PPGDHRRRGLGAIPGKVDGADSGFAVKAGGLQEVVGDAAGLGLDDPAGETGVVAGRGQFADGGQGAVAGGVRFDVVAQVGGEGADRGGEGAQAADQLGRYRFAGAERGFGAAGDHAGVTDGEVEVGGG